MKTVLSIAGSDSSGGAGIQADLKTIAAHGLYGMSVITALTAQNTLGVAAVQNASPEFVAKQLDCVCTDIFPDSVKIGMVPTPEIARVIGEKLRKYGAKNIVLDPVMVSTSGSRLMESGAAGALVEALFPLAALVTPNIPEAEALWGRAITGKQDMEQAAAAIFRLGGAPVLVKGGHLPEGADDLLFDGKSCRWLPGRRINNKNTHGTGCTLSSAIACGLAAGQDLETSVRNAKAYLTGALEAMLNLGHGSGPLHHGWRQQAEQAPNSL